MNIKQKKFDIGTIVTDGNIVGKICDYRKIHNNIFYYVKTKYTKYMILEDELIRVK